MDCPLAIIFKLVHPTCSKIVNNEKKGWFWFVLVLIVTTSILTVMLCMIGSIMSSTERLNTLIYVML